MLLGRAALVSKGIGAELCDRCVNVHVKHSGGNVMVWGDISWNGVGLLHRIEGTMDVTQYCRILSHSLLGSLCNQNTDPSTIIFQQDNDSKHKSRMATRWFEDHGITVLPWLSSSPNMNLIEHVWNVLDRKLRAQPTKPSNGDQLWEILQEEWEKIDVETISDLYRSIPCRLEALKKTKGGYTKYKSTYKLYDFLCVAMCAQTSPSSPPSAKDLLGCRVLPAMFRV